MTHQERAVGKRAGDRLQFKALRKGQNTLSSLGQERVWHESVQVVRKGRLLDPQRRQAAEEAQQARKGRNCAVQRPASQTIHRAVLTLQNNIGARPPALQAVQEAVRRWK